MMYPVTVFENMSYMNYKTWAQTRRSKDSEISVAAKSHLPYRCRSNACQPISNASPQNATDTVDADSVAPENAGAVHQIHRIAMPVDAMQHRTNAGRHEYRPAHAICESHQRIRQGLPDDIRLFAAELSHINQTTETVTRSPVALNNARPDAMTTAVRLMLLLSQVRQSPDADCGPQDVPTCMHSEASLSSPARVIPPVSAAAHILTPSVDAETRYLDSWLLPGASAMPAPSAHSDGTQETATIINNMRIIRDEREKGDLIRSLKQALVQNGWLDIRDAEDFEFSLKTLSSGVPLLIVPMEAPPDGPPRVKRLAQSKIDEDIVRHIAAHCAIEEEVLNANGEKEGKVLLYEAQRTENYFRRLYDGHDGGPSPEIRGAANGLNIATDLLSFGIKPLITSIIANAKRSEYYQSRGDVICAERYKHLSIASLSTSLDIDGLTLARKAMPRKAKPAELRHTLPADRNAAYFTRDPATGIRREILLRVAPGRDAIGDGSGNEVFLKPSGRKNEYLTYHPHAQRPGLLERRVVVDEKTMRWRYSDDFDTRELNVDIREGKRQISLHGEHYDLLRNADNQYEIVVRRASGEVSLLPVYMEPLSGTWHIAVENAQPVFTREQKALLERVCRARDDDVYYIPSPNNNAGYYGSGAIYRAEKRDDTSHYSYGTFVEMDGKLVPVTQRTTPGHGLHYEVVDPSGAGEVGLPVAFDGARWRFEADSAPQVSKEVKQLVTPAMLASDIQSARLSAPDAHGLNWDMQNNAYLKVDGSYIKVTHFNENRFAIRQSDGSNIILRFRDGKFFRERISERLQNIRTVGLNGHKEENSAFIISRLRNKQKLFEDGVERFPTCDVKVQELLKLIRKDNEIWKDVQDKLEVRAIKQKEGGKEIVLHPEDESEERWSGAYHVYLTVQHEGKRLIIDPYIGGKDSCARVDERDFIKSHWKGEEGKEYVLETIAPISESDKDGDYIPPYSVEDYMNYLFDPETYESHKFYYEA
ncbi:hypothetical protein [Robbsia andropogonis]|uniref:hypothetical protein n=1 Tax=Robbsia andropogonis TaxID=28092 RepID=UPI0004637F66|nr:hypothetical protein [Robbsia andropogonis]